MSPKSKKKVVRKENFYREYIEQNSEGIFRIDFEIPIPVDADIDEQCAMFYRYGAIAEFNKSFCETFKLFNDNNLTDIRGSRLNSGWDAFDSSEIHFFFKAGFRLTDLETQRLDKNGTQMYFVNNLVGVIEDGKLVCAWGTQQDITTKKISLQNLNEYERYWQQTQKIEALGRLAGGIAHDFNNFLAIMMLHIDMLNLQLPADNAHRQRIEEMKKATQNAAIMVRQLLAIGRKQALYPKPTQLNIAVTEFSKSLPTILSENIKIIIVLEPDPGLCFIDQNQLIQTLVNLALNAKEAMPEGGNFKIETANIVLDKNSVRHKSQSEGSFVQITVSDTGIGMDKTTLESIFDPFFSSKKSSKGVGLGLATAYGFVKQSKGFIWAESALNRGTTFKIQFPRIDQPA